MEYQNLETLKRFDVRSLPDLDVCVLGALELFATAQLPAFDLGTFTRLMVIGSVNAETTGRILFQEQENDVIFANESTYRDKLKAVSNIDAVVLVSASGGKHAVPIARFLHERNIAAWLLTNNAEAPAKQYVKEERVLVFPKNREPYTYNTSTYLGMILGKTKENPMAMHDFLLHDTHGRIPSGLRAYDAFFVTVPAKFDLIRGMLLTKFDELFGPRVVGRVFTVEQAKHAKTVIPSESEFFISFGEPGEPFGTEQTRLHIPLPTESDYGAMMAVGYYVMGYLQKQLPPYFKQNIEAYTKRASEVFGQNITPIVE